MSPPSHLNTPPQTANSSCFSLHVYLPQRSRVTCPAVPQRATVRGARGLQGGQTALDQDLALGSQHGGNALCGYLVCRLWMSLGGLWRGGGTLKAKELREEGQCHRWIY